LAGINQRRKMIVGYQAISSVENIVWKKAVNRLWHGG